MIVIALARVRFGSHAAVGLLACLTLLPNPGIETSTRIAIGAALGFFALITWWESHKRIAQFRFKPFYLRNINEGSAGILQGKVHVFHLFVDTEKVWSSAERSEVRAISTQALSWLVTQAGNFQVKLRFSEHEIWPSQQAIQAIPDAGASLSDHQVFGKWLDAVLDQQLQDRERTLSTNACLLVHIKDRLQTSWAYAVPKYKFGDGMCQLEYAVLGAPHDASVVAHELLHLFGADDFYLAAYWGESYNELQPREQLLGDCIMFTTKSEISNSIVDDLTAQSVGWL